MKSLHFGCECLSQILTHLSLHCLQIIEQELLFINTIILITCTYSLYVFILSCFLLSFSFKHIPLPARVWTLNRLMLSCLVALFALMMTASCHKEHDKTDECSWIVDLSVSPTRITALRWRRKNTNQWTVQCGRASWTSARKWVRLKCFTENKGHISY